MLAIALAALDGGSFGSRIQWYNFQDGMKAVKELDKPGIVIIALSWSGASKGLGKRIAQDDKVYELSKQFVMILAGDEDEPEDEKWLPGLRFCLSIRA